MTAHRPQEPFGRIKRVKFFAAEHLEGDQIFGPRHAMLIFRNPIERLQIAQTALPLFYIRLQHVALATLLFVAANPFFKLGFDEFGEAALKQIFAQCRLELGR